MGYGAAKLTGSEEVGIAAGVLSSFVIGKGLDDVDESLNLSGLRRPRNVPNNNSRLNDVDGCYHLKYDDVVEDGVDSIRDGLKNGDVNSINSLDDLLNNPNVLLGMSGKELYDYLVKNGYDVKPLSRGSFKGIPFEEGGGFKVNWGGDRILQYHPADLSHHGGAYFKISSGKTGTIRIDLYGNIIN